MSLGLTLVRRGVTLFGVLLVVLTLLVITLGATGFSDKVLKSIVNEELRGIRQSLVQTIRDPEQLQQIMAIQRAEREKFYRLDQHWYARLPNMIRRVVVLDLGEARTLRSFNGSSKVSDLVLERLPYTILLITTASAITALIGLPLGVKLATRVGSKFDRGVSYASAISYATPAWWAGIILILLLVYQFREWTGFLIFPLPEGLYGTPPPEGALGRFLSMLWHVALPVLTLVLVSVGAWTYVVRTLVLNTAQEFFVTVARAKGLPESRVMRRYILRVAAPPIATNLVFGITASLGGSIFNWPGMGRLTFEAIMQADEAVIIALTFMFTLLYIVARFVLEVLYVILDPRIRYT